jgi:hypothetical protein
VYVYHMAAGDIYLLGRRTHLDSHYQGDKIEERVGQWTVVTAPVYCPESADKITGRQE